MTVLSVLQRACSRLGLAQPTAAVTSTDQQVLQLLGLLNEDGQDLSQRHRWQALTREATHTTLAAESQGTLESIVTAANGLNYVLADTFWDRTNDRPIIPISSEEWQREKAYAISGPYYRYRIRQDTLYFIPAPSAGYTVAFEYLSKNWLKKSDDTARYDAANADTDVPLLAENILMMGVIWRFKQAKGFDFGADQDKYEALVADAIARDLPAKRLNMNGGRFRHSPHFINRYNIQEGNF